MLCGGGLHSMPRACYILDTRRALGSAACLAQPHGAAGLMGACRTADVAENYVVHHRRHCE